MRSKPALAALLVLRKDAQDEAVRVHARAREEHTRRHDAQQHLDRAASEARERARRAAPTGDRPLRASEAQLAARYRARLSEDAEARNAEAARHRTGILAQASAAVAAAHESLLHARRQRRSTEELSRRREADFRQEVARRAENAADELQSARRPGLPRAH